MIVVAAVSASSYLISSTRTLLELKQLLARGAITALLVTQSSAGTFHRYVSISYSVLSISGLTAAAKTLPTVAVRAK